jgi:N-carbamoylputrescine amidase
MTTPGSISENTSKAIDLVRKAAKAGANIVCLQELFNAPYPCQSEAHERFAWAESIPGPTSEAMSRVAKECSVVVTGSVFERRAQGLYHNTALVFDTDGSQVGFYRKMHIPDDPHYYEKFYFTPGDTGFTVAKTKFGTIGVGVCWDQWYPEAARLFALCGAEILLYPTAIGSEPDEPTLTSYRHWARTMLGHAAANLPPVVASNRVGVEAFDKSEITLYGGSFVGGQEGEVAGAFEQFLSQLRLLGRHQVCRLRATRDHEVDEGAGLGIEHEALREGG